MSPGISGIVGKLEKQSNSPKTKNRTALEKVVCSHLVNDLECHFNEKNLNAKIQFSGKLDEIYMGAGEMAQ